MIFDVETGERLAEAAGDPRGYRHPEFSTFGKYFAKTARKERPAIELYDVDTGKLLRKLTPKSADAKEGGAAAFSCSNSRRTSNWCSAKSTRLVNSATELPSPSGTRGRARSCKRWSWIRHCTSSGAKD